MSTNNTIKKLCELHEITIQKLEKDLGLSNGSLMKSGVMKSDRLKAIAKYFGVSMEYLLGSEEFYFDKVSKTWFYRSEEENKEYYDNKESEDYAEYLHKNPEKKVLFDAVKKVKPEDMQKALKAINLFIDEE